MRLGKLYGIGVGPGDPELITMKAIKILKEVDVVLTPKSGENKDSMAFSIVKKILSKDFKIIDPVFPMIKDEEILEKHWNNTVDLIFSELKEGKNVAFITIGDPLFYSTYSYVVRKMKERYPEVEIETVPGITSLSACLAELNIPLGEKDERIGIFPASYGLEKLEELANIFDSLVLMKVSKNFDEIVRTLEKTGLKNKSIFVSRCGSEDFVSSDLDSMVGKEIDYFSMIIIKGK
ncbi:MAG: precorrin-2 C(20)-methyltransferase [Candidatus Hydrothermarchaeota archaeon]